MGDRRREIPQSLAEISSPFLLYAKEVKPMTDRFEIMVDPQKYGYTQCPHCNGYGSSLKDPEGVDTCTMCHGWGLVKKEENERSE